MKKLIERLKTGLFTENPVFVQVLAMCPTLAVTSSVENAIGMGLGFTVALTVLACIRELLGAGTIYGFQVLPSSYEPMGIMQLAPGAFITLGILLAIMNQAKISKTNKVKISKEKSAEAIK